MCIWGGFCVFGVLVSKICVRAYPLTEMCVHVYKKEASDLFCTTYKVYTHKEEVMYTRNAKCIHNPLVRDTQAVPLVYTPNA